MFRVENEVENGVVNVAENAIENAAEDVSNMLGVSNDLSYPCLSANEQQCTV